MEKKEKGIDQADAHTRVVLWDWYRKMLFGHMPQELDSPVHRSTFPKPPF